MHTETDGLVGSRIHSDSNLTTIQNGPARSPALWGTRCTSGCGEPNIPQLRITSGWLFRNILGVFVIGFTMLHHKLLDELLSLQNWLHHDTPVIKRTALAPLTSCSDPSGVFAVASLSPAQLPNINHRPYHPQMGRFAIGLTVPHYPPGS